MVQRRYFRQTRKYRLAQLTELAAPAIRALRFFWVRGNRKAPEEWKEIVLLGADHIGDVLYRTIGLAELKAALPNCRIRFVASRPAADLLENNPSVDAVSILSKSVEDRSIDEVTQLLTSIAPDAVFCYDTGDYWRDQLAVTLAKVPECVGYSHKGFSGFVSRSIPIRFPQPFAAYFRDFVENIAKVEVPSLRPQIFPNVTQRNIAMAVRDELAPGGGPMVAASLTSRQPSHRAIQRRMAESMAELKGRVEVTVVLLGAPEDENFLRSLAMETGLKCGFATGRLSVVESVAFFGLADVAFCLDSGPRHMANAAGVPVVFCRNLDFLKVEAGRYLDTEVDIAPDVELVSYEGPDAPPLFEIETAVQALLRSLQKRG